GALRHPRLADIAHIPGKRGLPLIGVMPEVILDPLAFSQRMVAKHGLVYRFHALGKWHLHFVGAEANERILFDEQGIFSAEAGWGPLIAPLFPGALLVKDGAEHRSRRRLLGEAFKQAELSGYQRIFARDIDRRVESWSDRTIDPYVEARALTFHIAASTFLGVPLEEEANVAIRSFAAMMGGLLTLVSNPRLSIVRRRGFAGKARLERILTRLIEEKRAAPGSDFLSRIALLEDERGLLPVQEINDSFIFLLSAAHDTMASAITSLTYFLAAHPRWAAELRSEIEEAGIGDPLEAATARLPLQDMFYKETLRLNNPAPVIWRRAVKPFSIHGYDIPAGTMTGTNLMMTHRLPDLWPDPLRFDPLRFEPEAEKARSRFAHVPFGAGVHKCLGMHFSQQQARIYMTHLLLNADLELADRRPPVWYHWPNCRPKRSLSVGVRPRYPGR
ncbi:cytochrome P450, partial [Allosphingosinicella sp.]|uniref:cytochrome P450 n=1 Tax=Allosphingosinicella sp. TaxID=2823234 RepID=UPI002EE6D696